MMNIFISLWQIDDLDVKLGDNRCNKHDMQYVWWFLCELDVVGFKSELWNGSNGGIHVSGSAVLSVLVQRGWSLS